MNNLRLAIIMCTWKRLDNLPLTFADLENQSFDRFDFFIWNNSPDTDKVNAYIAQAPIRVEKVDSKNIGGLGRFHYAKQICHNYDFVIFIDDDERMGADFVKTMLDYARPGAIVSRWGWKFNGPANYWDRTRVQDMQEADYCGTGGAILDAALFRDIKFKSIPRKYRFIEDLWLSFYAKHEKGFRLYGCEAPIEVVWDGEDTYQGLVEEKTKFLVYLEKKYRRRRSGNLIQRVWRRLSTR